MNPETRIFFTATACCLSLQFQVSWAQDKSSIPSSSNSTSANPTTTIAISAQVDELKIEQNQLKRMSEAIKRTRRAGMDLIMECTQPIEMAGEIDVIGQDVIPIMPATAEGFGSQYNPPRPKYINLHMDQLGELIPILQDEIDKLQIPDSEKDYATQPLQDFSSYLNDIRTHYKKLKSLTNTNSYDQVAITNEARGIDASCKGIDSARKKLLHQDDKDEHKEEKLEREQQKK